MNEWELLLTTILDCPRHRLYLDELEFNLQQKEFFISALKKRLSHIPLQYILAKTEFMGLEFKLNQNVFIPRPETEILVEYTLRLMSSLIKEKNNLRVVDLGTGSGCIAVSLAKFLSSNIIIDATDISRQALDIAKLNACRHQVKINFIQSDLFRGLKQNSYDIIVSNPPYVVTSQIRHLAKEIAYEPRCALDGGKDGLRCLKSIIKEAGFYLKSSGFLILEIGDGQLIPLKKFFKNIKNLRIIDIIKDYSDIERVLVARRYG